MKPTETFRILGDIGVIDWLACDPESEHLRDLINALCQYFFGEEEDCFSCMPYIEFEFVQSYFKDTGYEVDWFDLLTMKLGHDVRDIAREIVHFDGGDPYADEADVRLRIIEFGFEWCRKCQRNLKECLGQLNDF